MRHRICLLFTLAFIVAGCRTTYQDLTATTDVQHSGILGQQLRTSQDLIIILDQWPRTLLLVTKDYQPDPHYPDYPHKGLVAAGTTLQVNQVMLITMRGFPFSYPWYWTLARIEDGPHAGTEIAIAGEGPSFLNDDLRKGEVALLGSSLLRPVNQASTLSALSNMHTFSSDPQAPAKYEFYDSKSNQFATVTLIVTHGFLKLDGLWSGSLDKSYVRPKVSHVLASDKLNVPDLHPLTGGDNLDSRPLVDEIHLYPDEPNDQIILCLPFSDTNGPVIGEWVYQTDKGEVERGTFAGPVH